MIFLLIILLSILGALLYRAGGMGKEPTANPTWMPMWIRNTKARDFGIPSVMVLTMAVLGHLTWWLVLCFLLLFAAQTTYFKKKGTDSKWWNWLLVGLAMSAAMFPYCFHSGNWLSLLYRTVCLTSFVIMWSEGIDNDKWEEYGRGWIQIISLTLL
jgi:hypothetical protein